ncbi:DNA replication and repair protein RecF [Klebsiella pneumoniae]|nr:DNA replication and repair protein RecF [Klebsiella pneumoniae]
MENIGLSYLPFSTRLCSPLSRTLCTLGLRAVRVETGCADNARPKNADMSLTRLLIKDFRNIESADLALSPGFNFRLARTAAAKPACWKLSTRLATAGHFAVANWPSDPPRAGCVCSAWAFTGRRAGNRHRPDQRQTGRQQGAYRRHRRPQVAELAHLMPMQLITPEGLLYSTAAPKKSIP